MDIIELREIDGEEFISVCGYLTDGHVDKRKFAIAVNKEYELADDGMYVSVSEVEHIWAIQREIGADGSWELVRCSSVHPDALSYTYVDR